MNTQTNHRLVKAEPGDLSTVRALLQGCQLPGNDLTKEHLQHFFMVKSGTKVLGVVGLEIYEDNGLLRSLAVREHKRGSGLGKLLVQQIEWYAGEPDIRDMYLLTTTADQFFLNLGYEEVSRADVPEPILQSEEFSQICPSSAVSMKKTIDQRG